MMKRTFSFILLLALFLFSPVRSFADGDSTEPIEAMTQEEEKAPDICPITADSSLIGDEEPPFLVAEQKESDKQKEPDKFSPILGEAAGQEDLASGEGEEVAQIPDPFRPWNNAMFQINDKLYFWVLKPVAKGYKTVVSEPIRNLFYNFFDNLRAPARLVNNLLQGKMKGAGNEFIRFVFNSTAGLGGLADAAKELLHIQKTSVDFGQTLGRYGVGQWFYLVWPIIGPSSPRDTLGFAVDRAMYPFSYISYTNISFGAATGIAAFETISDTSFTIGDYEAFKKAAIDPYVSMRSAYVQNRKKAVEE
jgi:phospholipid-binding lipoprotein MlaA